MVGLVVQLLTLLLSIFSCSFVVFARPLDQHYPKTTTTCVFNLSASIQRSNGILSFNPETTLVRRRQREHSTKSSSFSLTLYSRDTLRKSPFKSYRELTLLRTQRQNARLSFIYGKLNRGLQHNKSSSDSFFTPVELQAPLTSDLHLGEYVAQVGFGDPSQQLYTLIDTGSDVTWVPSSIFDPSASQSYKVLTCDAPSCQKLDRRSGSCSNHGTCRYRVGYVDGTSTTGDFATDTLQLDDSSIPDFPFGFDAQSQDPTGLLGLGRGPLSLPSLQQAASFSYCLLDRDSTAPSTLDVGFVEIPSGAVTAPLLRNERFNTFYYVGLTGISVGGERLQIPASAFEIDQNTGYGGVIIDSGSTETLLIPEVYASLSDAFVEKVKGLPPAEAEAEESALCFQLTSQLNDLPVIAFHFGEQTLSLSANTYLMRQNDQNTYCLAFVPMDTEYNASVIGNIHQQELLVTYDLKNSLIGFSPNPNCQV